ncbi:hypothetical protein G9C85_17840 [Halorubellus sp. JP-L1]|uniref:hypothetical protein n=1 Tax=Halorubellus sp. JP-L1 TaxID=2715753 RepID=UPI001409AAC2|nr:hypothetical protein [Halorubellus sp. JP-L1]NHN43483.1 hypothetical protein [Halorubellus sp. JP-L1]
MEFHPERLVGPPRGWDAARVSVLSAVVFVAIYAYYALVHQHRTPFTLGLAIGMGTSGVAELLPESPRYLAAVLRLAGIGVLLALVVAVFVAPDVVFAT